MKVLHVTSSVDTRSGGPAMAVAGLCRAQKSAGLDISVVATVHRGQGRELADQLEADGINVTMVESSGGAVLATLRSLIRGHDVVHVHALWDGIQRETCAAARQIGKPYIVTPHGMLTPWSLGQKRIKKWLYLRS